MQDLVLQPELPGWVADKLTSVSTTLDQHCFHFILFLPCLLLAALVSLVVRATAWNRWCIVIGSVHFFSAVEAAGTNE